MLKFKIDNPRDWTHVLAGVTMPMASKGYRAVRMLVNATEKVAVFTADNPDMNDPVLVGAASGMFVIEYTAYGDSFVEFRSEEGAIIYVNSLTRDPLVKASEDETFTTVMPMERRSSELDRIMLWTRLNEKRREQALEADRKLIRERLKELEERGEVIDAKDVVQDDDKTKDKDDDPKE